MLARPSNVSRILSTLVLFIMLPRRYPLDAAELTLYQRVGNTETMSGDDCGGRRRNGHLSDRLPGSDSRTNRRERHRRGQRHPTESEFADEHVSVSGSYDQLPKTNVPANRRRAGAAIPQRRRFWTAVDVRLPRLRRRLGASPIRPPVLLAAGTHLHRLV